MKGRKTGGRVKGTPNKATAELKVLAKEHTQEALDTLVSVIRKSKSDQAKVMAIRELFDRGYGKAAQAIEHSGPEGGAIEHRVTDLSNLTNDQLAQLEHIAGVVGPASDPG